MTTMTTDIIKQTSTESYFKSVWYLRQFSDGWLFVYEFLAIKITKHCSIETNTEIGSKNPFSFLEEMHNHFY